MDGCVLTSVREKRMIRFYAWLRLLGCMILFALTATTARAQEPVQTPVPAVSPFQIYLPLIEQTTQFPPQTGSFLFEIDPSLRRMTVNTHPSSANHPQTRSNVRPLLAGSELSQPFVDYDFQTGNRLILRIAYRNITADQLFTQPFSVAVRRCSEAVSTPCTDNIVTSFEPGISDDDLGGDGILSPGETTSPLLFEIIHKGQPFSYAVDVLAGVEPLTSLAAETLTVLTGEVYNDATGLPLAGAQVEVIETNRALSPFVTSTTTDEDGRYRLVTDQASVRLRIHTAGFTTVERAATVPNGSRADFLDARLTPLDGNITEMLAVAGGTLTDNVGAYQLRLEPFALANDTHMQLTPVGGQGLIERLPGGWSPVAAVAISPDNVMFTPAATLTVAAPSALPAAGEIHIMRWDSAAAQWIDLGKATVLVDTNQIQLSTDRSGHYAFALADADHSAVSNLTLPADTVIATDPADRIILAEIGRHTRVTVAASAGESMHSGTPFAVTFHESYASVDGHTVYLEPMIQDFVFYAFPAGQKRLTGAFTVTPSRQL